MRDKKEFFGILSGIDGREFSDYEKLIGDFDFSRYVLKISRVQKTPDDASSVFLVRVPQIIAEFPPHLFNTPVRRTALEDVLIRQIADHIEGLAKYDGAGVSRRRLSIACPGQKILPRTSLVVTEEYVEARLYIDLPVVDGCIPGEAIRDIFFEDLPGIVNSAMLYCNLNEADVHAAADLMQDADQIRQVLATRGLVSFVAEGSLLSRLSSTDLPDYDNLVPFVVPETAKTEIDVPNSGSIAGLGIPAGVTLLLGDDYSGRVELMKSVAAGIYNHVSGDGRELVITASDAVYIASEPGRSVQRVDVSPFIGETSDGSDPVAFSSPEADAFAAQAASTLEALEVGARVLLFDESDSAPSFLSRDSRLQGVIPASTENTIPLAARARAIADELGVSIVVGGNVAVTEFIPYADTIMHVSGFEVRDITSEAKAEFGKGTGDWSPADISAIVERSRWVVPSSIDPSVGPHDAFVDSPETDVLQFGRSIIDLGSASQLADVHQTATIGLILYYTKLRYMDESRPLREILDLVDRDLSTEGLECLSRELRGDLARPRRYEIAAALNRLDTLRIKTVTD